MLPTYIPGTHLADSLTGTAGDDQIDAMRGDDTIRAGAGNDYVFAREGNDVVYGEDGADTLVGATGADLLDGGDGDDSIAGGDGADTLYGGLGNDVMTLSSAYASGSLGVAFGGAGDDRFIIDGMQSQGNSYELTGGSGSDRFLIGLSTASTTITDFSPADGDLLELLELMPADLARNPFGSGFLRAEEIGGSTVISMDFDGAEGSAHQWQVIMTLRGVGLSGIPASAITGGFDVTGSTVGTAVAGTSADDQLAGQYLDDTISGGAGNDRIDGSGGNDLLIGGDEEMGGDYLLGGNGDDTLRGGSGHDTLEAGRHNDLLDGGAGDDGLDGGLGDDVLYGGDGNDHLYDAWGRNQMFGGAGNDRLSSTDDAGSLVDGGEGDDILDVAGLDTVFGGAGNDKISLYGGMLVQAGQAVTVDAGDGNDELYFGFNDAYRITARGGLGVDTYRFATKSGAGSIDIQDFQAGAGGDILDITGIWALDWQARGINPFGAEGILRIVQSGADSVLQFDADGAAGDGFDWYTVAFLRNVDARSLNDSNLTGALNFDGSFANVHATGTAQADTLVGGVWDDTLEGLGGNDRLVGAGGQDLLDGGGGIDAAVFSGKRAAYAVGYDGASLRFVTDPGSGSRSTLAGIERIVFDDRVVALDMDGAAGQVYRLYQAAFNRTPDLAGVGFWIGMADKGMALTTIANAFMGSPEFADLYGGAPTNEALVRLFYVNALHRQPDEPGVAFWTGVLDHGNATAEQVLAGFSESGENIAAVTQVIGLWFDYLPYP